MTQKADRELEIRERLAAKIKIAELFFEDFSEEHSGHYHHATQPEHGASHVNLTVVSADFEGLNRVQRSRIVYEALQDLLARKGLHALTLKLLSPPEWTKLKEEGRS
jgi:BolA protein